MTILIIVISNGNYGDDGNDVCDDDGDYNTDDDVGDYGNDNYNVDDVDDDDGG